MLKSDKNYFGSKVWANSVLRRGVSLCRGSHSTYHIFRMRVADIKHDIQMLLDLGYPWQSQILRSWLHVFFKHHKGIVSKSLHAKRDSRQEESRVVIKIRSWADIVNLFCRGRFELPEEEAIGD